MAVRRGRRRGADETAGVRTPSPSTSVLDAVPATNGSSTNGASTNGSSSNGAKANGRAATAGTRAATPTGRPRIGDLLVERTAITREQLEEALLDQTKSGLRLGEILVAAGALDERQLTEVVASQFQLPLADLRRERPDPDALNAISESVARGLQVVPYDASTASSRCWSPIRRGPISFRSSSGRRSRRSRSSSPRRATCTWSSTSRTARSPVSLRTSRSSRSRARRDVTQEVVATAVGVNAPVVQVVNLIITQALRDRASDVHIEPQGDQVRVRVRIDGALHDVLDTAAATWAPRS